MNVGDVRNRNQPNVQNAGPNAAQPLEGRMGSRLCNFATGLAIVGMPSADNRNQQAHAVQHANNPNQLAHVERNRINSPGYFFLRSIPVGAVYGYALARFLQENFDPNSAMAAGAAISLLKELVDWCLDQATIYFENWNRHEAQD